MTRVRPATPTVACLDAYCAHCAHYRAVFHNVRHFEQFTQLILLLQRQLIRSEQDAANLLPEPLALPA
jgi:hypothetical protein